MTEHDTGRKVRRAPVALSLEPPRPEAKPALEKPHRAPRAASPASLRMTEDVFADIDAPAEIVAPAPRRRLPLAALFFGAASLLFGLWASSAVYGLIERMFAIRPELGWVAAALAVLALLALAGLIIREAAGLLRLNANAGLRARLAAAHGANEAAEARSAVRELAALVKDSPAAAAGSAAFAKVETEFVSGRDLVALAERDLLSPLDELAKRKVTDAAKRVSIVTAVSPRAFVDIGYVLFENARLIRAIAEIYGCRPGALGFLRLARETLAHLAVTGIVAMGDSLVQQIVGHGMAARISARLGEGVLNGVMTARIGFAAMDVTRPAPFVATPRPQLSSVMAALTPKSLTGGGAA